LILAKSLAAEAQFEAALAEVRAVLDVSPNDVQCHRLAAEILRRCGDLEAAGRHLALAVHLDPGDREARWLLGLLRADPAGTTEASGVARILVDDTFITLPFGAVCLEQGMVEEAAQVFTRLLRKDPNNAEAREGLEQALRARSRRKG
jgi:Flp pilus assembly protein TadD